MAVDGAVWLAADPLARSAVAPSQEAMLMTEAFTHTHNRNKTIHDPQAPWVPLQYR